MNAERQTPKCNPEGVGATGSYKTMIICDINFHLIK